MTTWEDYENQQQGKFDQIETEDGLVAGFVYGTLRPGFGNYEHFADCIAKDLGEGSVTGLLYASGIPFFDADGDGTVRGNLFIYDAAHPKFRSMALMELRAGYDWRIVTVTLDDGSQVEAGVWHDERAAQRGDLVETGDYEDYVDRRPGFWR